MPILSRSLILGALAATAISLSCEAAALRQITTIPVPGAPFDSYDIGYVDHGKYYLTDRSNKAIDVFDTKTNKFVSRVTGFVGVGSGGPTGGPNGVIVINNGREIWAGDGDSTVKVIDAKKGTIVDSISTGGKKRADEVAWDSKDGIFIIGNDAEDPPYLTLISTKPGHKILGKVMMPRATDGLEQPVYNAANGMFYVAVPEIDKDEHKGGIAIVDPRKASLVKIVDIANCRPQGLAAGRGSNWIVGCNAGSKGSKIPAEIAVWSTKTEQVVATTDKMGGADMAAYDKKLGLYLVGGREAPGGPSVGVIDAKTNQWVENIPLPPNPHSVAVDSATGNVYVPSGATGGSCGGCIVVLGK
jgi:DNA-binding beta-propeller fold protein YncE